MSELKRHTRSDRVKWIVTAVVILLMSTAIVGIGMQLFAKQDKFKPSEWFKKDTSQTDTLPDDETAKTSVADNDVTTEELARGVLASSSSFVGETSALSDTANTITYTSLPAHCRHIEIGDDLSGAIIVFDFPHFETPNHYASPSNYYKGTYITTSTNYTFLNNTYTSNNFALCKYTSSYPTRIIDFYDITSNTGSGKDFSQYPVTGYVLPDDAGTVTDIPTKVTISLQTYDFRTRHEYLNMYIYDPHYYNYSLFDKTTEYPYGENHDIDVCSKDIVTGSSYSDGFLAINLNNIKSDGHTLTLSGGSILYLTSSDFTLSGRNIYNSANMTSQVGVFYSTASNGSIPDSSYTFLCSYSNGYCYLRVDLENVTLKDAAPDGTFKYVKEPIHSHIQTYSECPVDNCTYADGRAIRQGDVLNSGYVIFDVAAYRSSCSSEVAFAWGNYNIGFYVVDDELVYRDYSVDVDFYDEKIISADMTDGYVYCELLSGDYPINVGDTSFCRFVSHEQITVTVETEGGSRQYEIRAYSGLDIQPAFGNGWYNADGYDISSIPQSTTFTEVLDIHTGHQSLRIFNPYNYAMRVTVHVDSEGDYTPSSVDYWQGYGDDGELYLFYDISQLRSIITAYLGNELDYSEIDVNIKTTSKNTSEQNNYRLATYTLYSLLNETNRYNEKYNFTTVTGDKSLGQFPLDNSVIHMDVLVIDRIVEQKQITVPVTFYGYIDDYATATVTADYVRYYNNVTETRIPVSAVTEVCARYETFGKYCVTDEEWQTVTENGKDYLFSDRSSDIELYIEVMRKSFKLTNSVNAASVELPIVTRSDRDGYFVQLQLDSFIAISADDSIDFVNRAAEFLNWDNVDTFPSRYLDQITKLFGINGYSALNGFELNGDYVMYNAPERVILIDKSQSVHYLNGIAIRIPDSCIKLGLYEYELELMDSQTFGVLGAEKPDNGWDKFTDNVGNFFGGAFDFFGSKDKTDIIKQVLFCVMAVLILVVVIKLISIIVSACKRRK